MIVLRETPEFAKWFSRLHDEAYARIQLRIDRLEEGNPGDHKLIDEGVFEMRIHWGPGYRLYFTRRGSECIFLLAGGDKASQPRDIRKALRLARTLNH